MADKPAILKHLKQQVTVIITLWFCAVVSLELLHC